MKLTLTTVLISLSKAQNVLGSICFTESPSVGDKSGTPYNDETILQSNHITNDYRIGAI